MTLSTGYSPKPGEPGRNNSDGTLGEILVGTLGETLVGTLGETLVGTLGGNRWNTGWK